MLQQVHFIYVMRHMKRLHGSRVRSNILLCACCVHYVFWVALEMMPSGLLWPLDHFHSVTCCSSQCMLLVISMSCFCLCILILKSEGMLLLILKSGGMKEPVPGVFNLQKYNSRKKETILKRGNEWRH